MRASREDALDLLRKWAAERTPLECRLRASGCVSRFRGTVNLVLEEGSRIAEPDGDAALEVRFRPSFEFAFEDASGRVQRISETLIVFLREDEGELNDFISLSKSNRSAKVGREEGMPARGSYWRAEPLFMDSLWELVAVFSSVGIYFYFKSGKESCRHA